MKAYGKLVHFDLYRLDKIDEIESLGLSDYLGKKDYICVIEWAEKIKEELRKFKDKVIWIKFEYQNKDERRIEIK